MKAIIMAGGEGTRLKSVTGDLPKPMVRLCGKPMLEHILALLRRSGVTEACITLRYRPEVIRNHFGDGSAFGIRLCYHEETAPLGTAGGVRACEDFYGGKDFLVISGDCACDFDLRTLMEAHHRHGSAVTMALNAHPRPLQYGIALTDCRGRVVRFVEKPDWPRVISDLVNTGIYMVSPAAMSYVPEGAVFDFAKDLFPRLMAAGKELRGLPMAGYWCDIGTPEAYHRCNLDALAGKLYLEDMPRPEPECPACAPKIGAGVHRIYRCRSRAHLMRLLSQTLMEAGADFSDGLRLDTESGPLHVSPAPDREALVISAASPALADDAAALLRRLDGISS